MPKFIILTLLALLLIGCTRTTREKPKLSLNENTLSDIVTKAINGERIYNDSLSELIGYSLPINFNFNNIDIKRIITPVNKTIFTVLIEYPNPVYNRFAVYDSALHLILMDKSLNGNIRLKTINFNNQLFIEINESFLSKDILALSRVSLYRADSAVTLHFRTFTKFTTPTNEYYQLITDILPDRIKINLNSKKRSILSHKSDFIILTDNQNINLNKNNTFINFIQKQIADFKRVPDKLEITDENSVLQSVGITKNTDTLKSASNIITNSGYYLTIDEHWKEIRDIVLDGYANRLRGDKYYNAIMGSNIFIALIPGNNSAEDLVKAKLLNVTQGKYKVRFTNKIEQRKLYVQYFEFSCGERKYLMIFEASKFTYNKYKNIYQDIINSFIMEC
jgi:hypothetical protein